MCFSYLESGKYYGTIFCLRKVAMNTYINNKNFYFFVVIIYCRRKYINKLSYLFLWPYIFTKLKII